MDTTKRLWWGTAVLSVSALFLTACGDDDADDAPADDAAAEETEENGEDAAQDEDADGDEADEDGEEGATALSEDEISELLLTEEELPVEVEEFYADETLPSDDALPLPDDEDIATCEDLAEAMEDADMYGEGAAQDAEDAPEMTMVFSQGMWDMETQEPSVLQTGIGSSSEEIDTSEDYDLIQECEGETFTQEDEEMGMVSETSFEYLEHGDWEGVVLNTVTSMNGETAAEIEMSTLTYQDGANTLIVIGMGEGEDYLEETADLLLEKYEAGV